MERKSWYEENFKTCPNFVIGNGHHYHCWWVNDLLLD